MPSDTVTVQSITKRRKRSRWTRWVFWLVVLAGLGGGGYWYWQGQASGTVAVRYTTTEVAKADITVIVTAVTPSALTTIVEVAAVDAEAP